MRHLKLAAALAVALTLLLLALRQGQAAIDAKDAPEPKIAVCEVVALINELMQSDRFAPARNEHEQQLREELIRPIFDRGKAIEAELREADPDDPANDARKQRLIELRELALPQAHQQAGVRLEQFVASQTIDAYSMILASARDIATDLGFNFLFSSESSERSLEELKGKPIPMGAVKQAILSRPALLFPESVDISDDVRDDLNLD